MREGVQVLQRSPSLGENTVHPSPVSPIRKIVGRLDLSPGKEDWSDQVHESSSKMRRGWSGQAVGLDEENNPSPTRLKRREAMLLVLPACSQRRGEVQQAFRRC